MNQIDTFFLIAIVTALTFYTFIETGYGYIELDRVVAPNIFHESGYVLQYCSEHASDSVNPVQDLVDKLKITWSYFEGETCTTVKQFHDAFLRKVIEEGTYMGDLEKLNDYCFLHAYRAAQGENVGNDLVNSGLVNYMFYDWSCPKIQEEIKNQGQ